ncbi:FeoA family protein [Porphyrobacter sp. GA68]|uniref:FeoA family protein n=1 Tax=Porphyrobacter sp. GA68 TaxID=2883480 RepID=UPI001D18305A|nr:FeoA family protein [Porphyrobacter sp. GA68]
MTGSTLNTLGVNRPARIVAVAWDRLAHDDAKRLRALGVDEGAQVSIAYRGVFGGREPIALRLGRAVIALRLTHAEAIAVTEEL